MKIIDRPLASEYPAYAAMYIDLVPADGRILEHMMAQVKLTSNLLGGLPETTLVYRYAPKKWTIREVLLHISDDERIYAYRALRYARRDKTPLPGFDQDDFARYSGANQRTMGSLLHEYETVRHATISLFENLPEEALRREGTGDGNNASVRAMLYHIAGHELHHLKIIRERYLST